MAVSKIVFGGETLIDLTADTVASDTLLSGVTAHDAAGNEISGTLDLGEYMLENVYPVGSIYMSVNNVSPAEFLGGTWETWGAGRVPVGVDSTDTDFSAAGNTGGSKTEENVLVSHSHDFSETTGSSGSHTHGFYYSDTTESCSSHTHTITSTGSSASAGSHTHSLYLEFTKDTASGTAKNRVTPAPDQDGSTTTPYTTESSGSHTHTITVSSTAASAGSHNHAFEVDGTTGTAGTHTHTVSGTTDETGSATEGSTHNNLQPYITCYMWVRTA